MPRLAWGSVGLAVLVCFGVWPLLGGDILMHLVIGRWSYEHGGPPLTTANPWLAAFLRRPLTAAAPPQAGLKPPSCVRSPPAHPGKVPARPVEEAPADAG